MCNAEFKMIFSKKSHSVKISEKYSVETLKIIENIHEKIIVYHFKMVYTNIF